MWISQSSPAKQTALAVLCMVVGLVLAWASGPGGSAAAGMTNAKAAFYLGILLVFIGALGFLGRGKQTVVVDDAARSITVEDVTCLGSRRRSIAFGEVAGVSIGYLGKKSSYVSCYYLVLRLRSGEKYSLFAPGRFYSGSSDRSVVEGWRLRLESCLRR